MSTESNDQYRAGFEAWARDRDIEIMRSALHEGYADPETDQAWQAWTASKRDASTEPSAIPDVLLDGYAVYQEVCAARGKRNFYVSTNAVSDTLDAVVRLMRKAGAAGPLTDDAKNAALLGAQVAANRNKARLEVFIDWYLREGSRSEVHLYGHTVPTTREIVSQWLDREARTRGRKP